MKPIIKSNTFGRIRFVFGAIVVFLISYILEVNFILPLSLICLAAYLQATHKDSEQEGYNFINLTLLFVIIFVCTYFILKQGWPIYYIPFSVIPMLTIILFGEPRISLVVTVASSLAIAEIANGNFYLGGLSLVSGIISIIFSQDVRRRMVIIRVGFLIGLVQAAALFFIGHSKAQNPSDYLALILNGIVSSIIVVGVLPVFEYLFKVVTNISLLELADFNQPILQRLMLEAPGTYHHSLIVGNLSEAACGAVGAHALLARIGAYYHDIGKLYKSEYFSENLDIKESKHDALPPTISKMVIMNHVKEGVDLAKKYKLNPRLVDFIQRHHGNSLVYYFYRRALENIEQDQDIKEEVFRYPGPKPNTKETAIVLLADSVEAAARSIKDPTPSKIEELAHKIINNKFIDGQLDACDLTLKDLEKISAVFIRILSGIYHNRVIYPEDSKS